MKSKRIPQMSTLESNQAKGLNHRALASDSATKIQSELEIQDISNGVAKCCAEDNGVALRLRDEFSKEIIVSVIKECRAMISENSMTSENWKAIKEFLSDDLWQFSRLKEELVLAERKCNLVQQKANDISNSGGEDDFKTRLMACAMLLAETQMRRDHFEERISMIIDEFVTRILSEYQDSAARTGIELRLRAVFGGL
jgi:hypothetical protein